MKLYGIRYMKADDSVWNTFYAFSHDIDKLKKMAPGCGSWFVGTSDVTNNKYEVSYTNKEKYPRYSIVEVPFVV